MKDIVSALRSSLGLQRSSVEAPNDPDLAASNAGAAERDPTGSSVDLYECPACNTVLIEPASDECSQCPDGTLLKV
ncbi:hypothetical protein G9464_18680 [Halostella sp. JP-L12]|uniref:hypothetical protein n=1 Tax=Halostella TaxID=1843185 RepID=UPI0013CEB28F|nr:MULTISPECIES: hypothetical protein [Halostella]NHN49598.1 hypothetical protein [Halostella sp. JP-L12]